MLEDRTGMYGLAKVVNASVILAAMANPATRVVKPNLRLVDRVYFVPSDALNDLLTKVG